MFSALFLAGASLFRQVCSFGWRVDLLFRTRSLLGLPDARYTAFGRGAVGAGPPRRRPGLALAFLRPPRSPKHNPALQCDEKVPIPREGEEKKTKLKERKVKGGAETPTLETREDGPLSNAGPSERADPPVVGGDAAGGVSSKKGHLSYHR